MQGTAAISIAREKTNFELISDDIIIKMIVSNVTSKSTPLDKAVLNRNKLIWGGEGRNSIPLNSRINGFFSH